MKIISKQEFWDALPNVMYHMEEDLWGCLSAVALYFLSKEAAEGMSRQSFRGRQMNFSVDIILENRKH